jgi:hypothetical protein
MPKPLTPQLMEQLLATLERLVDRWEGRGYCPHCLVRVLLLHSGLLAAHELGQDEMREALTYIADLSAKHCPSQATRH